MAIKKIEEVRPKPCGTRIGDFVEIDGKKYLQVKCRRCTKLHGHGEDVFHYILLNENGAPADLQKHE